MPSITSALILHCITVSYRSIYTNRAPEKLSNFINIVSVLMVIDNCKWLLLMLYWRNEYHKSLKKNESSVYFVNTRRDNRKVIKRSRRFIMKLNVPVVHHYSCRKLCTFTVQSNYMFILVFVYIASKKQYINNFLTWKLDFFSIITVCFK